MRMNGLVLPAGRNTSQARLGFVLRQTSCKLQNLLKQPPASCPQQRTHDRHNKQLAGAAFAANDNAHAGTRTCTLFELPNSCRLLQATAPHTPAGSVRPLGQSARLQRQGQDTRIVTPTNLRLAQSFTAVNQLPCPTVHSWQLAVSHPSPAESRSVKTAS